MSAMTSSPLKSPASNARIGSARPISARFMSAKTASPSPSAILASSSVVCAPQSSTITSPFDLMQKTSSHFVGRRQLLNGGEPEGSSSGWADWLYQEADAMRPKATRGGAAGAGAERGREDLNAAHAKALLPLLSLNGDSVFVEAGDHCRGRLPMNLALNQNAKKYITLNPSLQRTVDASQLSAPLVQAPGLLRAPVTFLCCAPENWHYREVTHVLLHNEEGGPGRGDACRGVVARLAASPTFRVLFTLAPLPLQTSLIYIGERALRLEGEEEAESPSTSSPLLPSSGSAASSSSRGQLPRPAPPTVYIYSTSWTNVPVGTLSALFCTSGVCHLPSGVTSLGGGLSLPPLAAHTASFQDMITTGMI